MKRCMLALLVTATAGMSCLAIAQAGGATTAWVKPLDAAQSALASGEVRRAYTLYMRHARSNPLAQFVIGQFHQNGWGRPADPVAACGWFEKAARQGIPTAAHLWGDCLAHGIGRAPDVPEALAWYDRAAAHGHLLSLCTAGDRLIRGDGVQQDAARGMAMCTRAAQAHVPSAMLTVGRHLDEGRHVPQDLAAARQWYELAARQHRLPEAQYRLGLMQAQGLGGNTDLNAALFWLEQAASEGHAPAYLPTALLYGHAPPQAATGALAPEHLAKAYLWAKAAGARQANPDQRDQARQLEAELLARMPATWQAALDRKVAEHLSRFAAAP